MLTKVAPLVIATFFSDKKVAKKSVGLFSLAINRTESLAPARSNVAMLRNATKTPSARLSLIAYASEKNGLKKHLSHHK